MSHLYEDDHINALRWDDDEDECVRQDLSMVCLGPGEFFVANCDDWLEECAAGKVPGYGPDGKKIGKSPKREKTCAKENEKEKDDDDDDNKKGGQSIQYYTEPSHSYQLRSVAEKLRKSEAEIVVVDAPAAAAAAVTEADAAKKFQEKKALAKENREVDYVIKIQESVDAIDKIHEMENVAMIQETVDVLDKIQEMENALKEVFHIPAGIHADTFIPHF
ncbi:hypothetical protein CAEBREN_26001 [Caenorhabditis brenneri]|uniref:Uncharacterized protein n=1 Tax=Caenorhabditis brenneri TaxID=135651 RepID=G0NFE0_CAEBE|nr:hypothetical protein CAEBREN_26001 [Caenorhabditis brenneri]